MCIRFYVGGLHGSYKESQLPARGCVQLVLYHGKRFITGSIKRQNSLLKDVFTWWMECAYGFMWVDNLQEPDLCCWVRLSVPY